MTDSEFLRFDPLIPIERALTPPASWYVDPRVLTFEKERIFLREWHYACALSQLTDAGQYVTGCLLGEPWAAIRGRDGKLRAFSNVCRHHAAEVLSREGRTETLVCPYHGWTYDLDGRLLRAPHIAGIQEFDRKDFGLRPLHVGTFGPFVFVSFAKEPRTLGEDLAELAKAFEPYDLDRPRYHSRRVYEMACNWKVFVDNYLDGGYHVGHLHGGLASQLDLTSYTTIARERFSLQTVAGGADKDSNVGGDFRERIGRGAAYAFIHPNFMINRYGPITDTNLVIPLTHDRTRVIFDYWFEEGCDEAFIAKSVEASHQVQLEDQDICESVQRGLASRAYDTGRYAPKLEHAMHAFHRTLAVSLRSD